MSDVDFLILLLIGSVFSFFMGILITSMWYYPSREYKQASLEAKPCKKCGEKPFFLINRYGERWLVCQSCCGNHRAYSGEYESHSEDIDHTILLWNTFGREGVKK